MLNGLQANTAHRALSGFLIFFLAFLLREQPLAGQSAAVSLGIVGVAAGAGNALGTAFGAWLRARGPEVIVASVLTLALGAAVLAALFFSTVMVAALSATAGFTQALSKLSLDAMIQRDVPEEVRTSAFARSETVLQMAWVVGGGIGIVLPSTAYWACRSPRASSPWVRPRPYGGCWSARGAARRTPRGVSRSDR